MKSLIGFHSFTGCDIICSFAGRRKVKPLNLTIKDVKYIEEFAERGEHTYITGDLLQTIKSFVCHMYGWKGDDRVDELQYRMYCQSGEKIACEQQPCSDDTKRSIYQTRIWRESLLLYKNEVDPQEHSWVPEENGDLDIKWMTCNPAPDEVSIFYNRTPFIQTLLCLRLFIQTLSNLVEYMLKILI